MEAGLFARFNAALVEPSQADQFIMDDFDDLLAGMNALNDLCPRDFSFTRSMKSRATLN